MLAKQLKQEIASLEFMASGPVGTVEVKQVEAYVQCLQAFFDRDVLGGREYLRKLLKGRGIHLKVNPRGIYMAKSELFPMVLLTEPPPPVDPEGAVSSQCCGGAIGHLPESRVALEICLGKYGCTSCAAPE